MPPPPSSAAVVGFVLKFLAGYGNTLQSTPASIQSTGRPAVSTEAGDEAAAPAGETEELMLASFGSEPKRDKALGMHRLVSPAWLLCGD